MRPAKCLVIKYACVRERHYTDGQRTFCIDSNTFVKEVDELCNRLEPIDWEWFWAWKQGRKSIPAESFLLTFDDVLRKQVEVVAPILETRNIGAAFFVATTPPGNRKADQQSPGAFPAQAAGAGTTDQFHSPMAGQELPGTLLVPWNE